MVVGGGSGCDGERKDSSIFDKGVITSHHMI